MPGSRQHNMICCTPKTVFAAWVAVVSVSLLYDMVDAQMTQCNTVMATKPADCAAANVVCPTKAGMCVYTGKNKPCVCKDKCGSIAFKKRTDCMDGFCDNAGVCVADDKAKKCVCKGRCDEIKPTKPADCNAGGCKDSRTKCIFDGASKKCKCSGPQCTLITDPTEEACKAAVCEDKKKFCQLDPNGGNSCVCLGTCPKAAIPGAKCDPHITGFDGSHYLLKGKVDKIYSLLSEGSHQINIKLFSPKNFSVPGLWIGDVGILAGTTRVAVHLLQGPRAALSLQLNDGRPEVWSGKPVMHGVDDHTTVSFVSSKEMKLSAADMTVAVMLKYDPYFKVHHLDVVVEEVSPSWTAVHGILGQTYSKAYGDRLPAVAAGQAAAVKKELQIEGGEDDYIVTALFAVDDKFNKFKVSASERRLLQAADIVSRPTAVKITSSAKASMAVIFDEDHSVFELSGAASRRALLDKVKAFSCGGGK